MNGPREALSPLRILHVIPDLSPDRGGSLSAVLGMAEAQAALSHRVTIAATDFGSRDFTGSRGVATCTGRCWFDPWKWSPGFAGALPEIVQDSDIVHIHTIWEYPVYASAKVCRKALKPYIIRPCGMLSPWSLGRKSLKKKLYRKWVMAEAFRSAAAFHFTSRQELEHTRPLGLDIRGFVVPNGLPPSALEGKADPQAFHRRFPAISGRPFLLFLGRLDPVKQVEVALEAFQRARFAAPDHLLVIAGTGDPTYLKSLHRLAARLDMAAHVIFTGLLRGEEVWEAYAAASLFLLPSLHENFGFSVAEAMAAGCPVIVSDRVDLAPFVKEAGAGLVGRPDAVSFAEMIAELAGNRDLRSEMGSRGRELVRNRFAWGRIALQLTGVYRDLLGGRRDSPAWREW